MSEWVETRLGDVLTLQRGFDLPARARKDGPFPIVSSAGITGRHEEYKVEPPGVVIGRYGSLGSVHWLTEPFWPLNTSLWVREFKGNDERFISYLLRTLAVDGSTASAVPGVNRNHLHRLPVKLPSAEAQRRIAAALSLFDDLVEINERRIELLEDLARSLYREWFVRRRFPGHRKATFVGSEVGPIPESWEVPRLSEVATVNKHTFRTADLPDPLRYLDISSVGVGRLGEPSVIDAAEAPGRARRGLRDGDVIWATVRPNRRAHALVHDPAPDLVASTGLAVISPETIPASFLFLHASQPAFTEYLMSRATGSAYPAVRPGDFEQAPIAVPTASVLKAFDRAAGPRLRLASVLIAHNRALAATRDLLLPRLVTGRLDISDVDLGELEPAEAA